MRQLRTGPGAAESGKQGWAGISSEPEARRAAAASHGSTSESTVIEHACRQPGFSSRNLSRRDIITEASTSSRSGKTIVQPESVVRVLVRYCLELFNT